MLSLPLPLPRRAPWPVIQYGGNNKQMRNNQPNKGSNEAAATRANNQPNNSMERHHGQRQRLMVNGNGSWSAIQRKIQSFRRFELLEFDFMTTRRVRI
jgi:hypothetical protein